MYMYILFERAKQKELWISDNLQQVTHNFAKWNLAQFTNITRNTYITTTLVKLEFLAPLKLSPVGRGKELDRWPTTNIVVRGSLRVHFILSFLFLSVLSGFIWKKYLAVFQLSDLEKK